MPIEYENMLPTCCGEILEPSRPLKCPYCGSEYDADEALGHMNRMRQSKEVTRRGAAVDELANMHRTLVDETPILHKDK